MDFLADLRYALRLLRKTPVFAVAAIGTLALGIGANTTIFSLVQTMLLEPLPYQDPARVVMVWEDRTAAGFPRTTPAPGNYRDWQAMNRSFTDMAATAFAFANLTGDAGPELVIGRRVTANFFSVLGIQPVIGRTFTPADDTPGQRVVVISHALWQRRYGGDPGIVGRTISMTGQGSGGVSSEVTLEVIGVAPRSFVFLSRDDDYWVPMQFSPQEAAGRGNHFLNVVARLKPDVTLERGFQMGAKPAVYVTQAQGPRFFPTVNLMVRVDADPLGYAPAVQRIIRSVDPDQPVRLIRSMTEVIALTVGDRRQQTTLLVVFGSLALIIASLGLYGLLAQTVSVRGREIGIRMALGATWRSVMQLVMLRGIVLTGAGVGIGAVLAWSVTRAMDSLLYGVGAADPLTFALVAGLLTAVSAVACGIPAVRAARVDPMLVLRDQ